MFQLVFSVHHSQLCESYFNIVFSKKCHSFKNHNPKTWWRSVWQPCSMPCVYFKGEVSLESTDCGNSSLHLHWKSIFIWFNIVWQHRFLLTFREKLYSSSRRKKSDNPLLMRFEEISQQQQKKAEDEAASRARQKKPHPAKFTRWKTFN